MKFLDRYVNPVFEAMCLLIVVLIGMYVDWRLGFEITIVLLLAGAVLKIVRTDRGVTELWDAIPSHQMEYFYPGFGIYRTFPGMGKLTLRSIDGTPFSALIGVRFEVPLLGIKFHPFGRVTSNAQGVAIVRTWLGRGPATFMYLCSIPGEHIIVSYNELDQDLPEDVTNWPHLFQLFL